MGRQKIRQRISHLFSIMKVIGFSLNHNDIKGPRLRGGGDQTSLKVNFLHAVNFN